MNYLPFDFHTPPYDLVFKQEPDYATIQKNVQILNLLTEMNKQSICIIDFYKHNYFYVSPNHLFMCGYTYDEMKEMGGEKMAGKIIYEEDRVNQVEMKNAACIFMASLDMETQKKASIFSTHRLIHRNGTIFTISNQYRPFLFDDNQRMWMALVISNFSTKNYFIESYIEIEDTKERFVFSAKKKEFLLSHKMKLSLKEQEILKLSSQGYTSKEISLEKNISISTVKFHKKNILLKLNVQNISEAMLSAYVHNLF